MPVESINSQNISPVANSTQSYWRSQLHTLDNVRTSEQLPEECDILIIGAGLSGVSTAYHLLTDNDSPPSVVLLEAREVCSGATGRNGGHLSMVYTDINKVAEKQGWAAARELAKFQAEQVYAMKDVARKERLDCEALLTRYYETILAQSHADELKTGYERHLELGLDFIRDVDFIDSENAETISGVKGTKAVISTTALQLWPYKFVTELLARLVERTFINVQTHTPVTSILEAEGGVSIVHTPRGSIRAGKIVFATNGYTAGIAPIFSKKIVPIKVTCSHISAQKDSPHPPPRLSNTYGLNYDSINRDYLIPRPDGGVICGGAKKTYIKDKKLWFNNFDDSTLIEPAREHFETVMQKNYHGWEKSEAAVDYWWTGIMGYTADGRPHCGKVPGQENHYVLAGFNGAGMPVIFLTAKGIAGMVKDNVPFARSGIPRIFETSKERLQEDVIR